MSYEPLPILYRGMRQKLLRPVSVQHSSRKLLLGVCRCLALNKQAAVNWSAHADSQQQKAAARQVLCAGGLQR